MPLSDPLWRRLGRGTRGFLLRRLLAPGMPPAPEPSASTPDPAESERRTDELNRAAEDYFARYPEPEFILGKPYSEERLFARRLFDLGVLFHALDVRKGDVVLELGAGTCWVSHFLNLYGCRTVAVDVSATALELGHQLFARDSRTRWDLAPQFLPYDGHRLPLAAAACDKVVVYDAFHHVPNRREILREMARVLRPGGAVGLREPGPRHSETAASRREVERTGVLESDLVVTDLAAVARECGFAETTFVPAGLECLGEVPVARLERFRRGEDAARYWHRLVSELDSGSFLVLRKNSLAPTTLRPSRPAAAIELLEPGGRAEIAAGVGLPVRLRLRNVGDTVWLALGSGCTRLGAHLYGGSRGRRRLDYDWLREELPGDVAPGEAVEMTVELPPLPSPGRYRVAFDLVIERLAWLERFGSRPTSLDLVVDGTRPSEKDAGRVVP